MQTLRNPCLILIKALGARRSVHGELLHYQPGRPKINHARSYEVASSPEGECRVFAEGVACSQCLIACWHAGALRHVPVSS